MGAAVKGITSRGRLKGRLVLRQRDWRIIYHYLGNRVTITSKRNAEISTIAVEGWSSVEVAFPLSVRTIYMFHNATEIPKQRRLVQLARTLIQLQAKLAADKTALKSEDTSKVSKQEPTSEPSKRRETAKSMAQEDMSGEGGAAGIEYEDGKPQAMKRSVRNNMFRYI
jgi:hypothetical protein